MSSRLSRAACLLGIAACATPPPDPAGDAIVVAGERIRIGTPVVLWTDPSGYDAYSLSMRFGPHQGRERPATPRHGDRSGKPSTGWTRAGLAELVDLFVVHYDVCGTARQCFKILHDVRGLSVHFLLDVDGTIYQTLDVAERAWHAGHVNDRSVGVEIAQIGAYPSPGHPSLRQFYGRDAGGPCLKFPAWMTETDVRTPAFAGRPARSEFVHGEIHGRELWQYDYTPEQYRALACLIAGLHRALPRIRLEFPADESGALLRRVLTSDELAAYQGVLGHWHVSANKTDPGPAFDWNSTLSRARSLLP